MSESIATKLDLTTRRKRVLFICRIAGFTVLAVLFLMHPGWVYKSNSTGIHFAKKRILVYFILSVLMIFLPCYKLKISRKIHYLLNIPLIAVSVFGIFVMGEYVMKFDFRTTAVSRIIINLVLIFGIFLFFYVITNKVKKSLFITYIIIVGFAILNYFVYEFRGEPINAADIYVVGTAMNVAGDYSFDINRYMFDGLFVGFCFGSFLLWLPADTAFKRGLKRLYIAVPALIFIICTGYVFAVSDWPKEMNIKVKVFNPYKCYHLNGLTLNFIRGFYYMQLDKPKGYTAEAARKNMDSSGYVSDAADADSGTKKPNVIVIMNESLTDFTTYDSVKLSDDPLKFIHSLKGSKNAITGNLHMDVFGGRTANSEYEYQTGNSIAFMPANAVPYALYVRKPEPSVTWNMRDIGYCGDIAFHPYLSNGYSRPRAYPNLGFTDFVSLETIESQIDPNTDHVRNKVSDQADFEWVEKLYQQQKETSEAPYYMFNVTIQNHGGYLADNANFIQDIDVSGEFASDDSFKRFINLVDYSDEAFQKLTEYYQKVDEPTIIVMFGDHRPNLHNGFFKKLYGVNPSQLKGKDIYQHYETPLVIWANYDINPDGKYDTEFANMSVNYLSAAVTQLAGLPQTAYQKFLNSMRKQIPVFTQHGYLDAAGNSYSLDDSDSPYYKLINQYHLYEYNYQFDTKNRNDEFFMLKSDSNAMYKYEDESKSK